MDGLGLVGALCIAAGLGLMAWLVLRSRARYGDVEPQEADLDTIAEATPMPETYRTAGRVYASGRAHVRSVPMCNCSDGGIGSLLDPSDPWCRRCGGAR